MLAKGLERQKSGLTLLQISMLPVIAYLLFYV